MVSLPLLGILLKLSDLVLRWAWAAKGGVVGGKEWVVREGRQAGRRRLYTPENYKAL